MAARKPLSLRQTLYSGFTPLDRGAIGQRASAEAQLRYAPQLEALLLLLGQRRHQQTLDVSQVKRGGLAAAGGIGGVRSSFQQQLADTPAPTSQAADHLGLTRDAVSGILARMQAQQYAGINSGVTAARRNSQLDQLNILSQARQAAQQGALYNVSQYDALANDNRKFVTQQRQARATLIAGLAKAGLGPDGKPIPGMFNRIHPGRTPHAPVDGIDYQTYLNMTPAQRQAAHKSWVANGGGGSKNGLTASQRAAYGKVQDTIDSIASDLPKLSSTVVHLTPAGTAAKPDSAGNWPKGTITRPLTQAEITGAIQKKYGTSTVTPIVLHAATQKAHGGIRPDVYHTLRRRYPGMRLPGSWLVALPTPSSSGGHRTPFGGPGN